jgi:hypothetical protein
VKTGQNQVLYRFSVLFILLLKTPQPVFTSPGASLVLCTTNITD